jgi:hypothetical protein
MRNVSDKILEKIKTYIFCSVTFVFPENLAFGEIILKMTSQYGAYE